MSLCFIRNQDHQGHLKENWTLRPWEPKLLTGHAGWQSPLTTSGGVEGEGLRRVGVIDSGCVHLMWKTLKAMVLCIINYKLCIFVFSGLARFGHVLVRCCFSIFSHVLLQSHSLNVNCFPETLDLPEWYRKYVSWRGNIWGRIILHCLLVFLNMILKILKIWTKY